jgi:DNA-binding Xre family transcriptional regulator
MAKKKISFDKLASGVNITALTLEALKELTPRWSNKTLEDALGITGTQLKQLEQRLNKQVSHNLQAVIEAALLRGVGLEIPNVLAIEVKEYTFRTGGPNYLAVAKGEPLVERPFVSNEGLKLAIKTRDTFKTRLNK